MTRPYVNINLDDFWQAASALTKFMFQLWISQCINEYNDSVTLSLYVIVDATFEKYIGLLNVNQSVY